MDSQIKRGMLDVCVLSVLFREDSYGYQIMSDISACVEISESTLYPILRRLEQSECLTTYSTAYNGRLRKYYSITEEGRARVREFLEGWHEIEHVCEYIRRETGDSTEGRLS